MSKQGPQEKPEAGSDSKPSESNIPRLQYRLRKDHVEKLHAYLDSLKEDKQLAAAMDVSASDTRNQVATKLIWSLVKNRLELYVTGSGEPKDAETENKGPKKPALQLLPLDLPGYTRFKSYFDFLSDEKELRAAITGESVSSFDTSTNLLDTSGNLNTALRAFFWALLKKRVALSIVSQDDTPETSLPTDAATKIIPAVDSAENEELTQPLPDAKSDSKMTTYGHAEQSQIPEPPLQTYPANHLAFLIDELRETREKLATANDEISQRAELIKKQQTQIETLTATIADSDETASRSVSEEQFQEICNQRDEAYKERHEAKAEIIQQAELIKKQQTQIETLAATIADSNETASRSVSEEQLEEIRNERDEANKQYEELEAAYRDANDRLSEAYEERDVANSEIAEQEELLNDQRTQIETLRKGLVDTYKTLAQSVSERDQANEEVLELITALCDQFAAIGFLVYELENGPFPEIDPKEIPPFSAPNPVSQEEVRKYWHDKEVHEQAIEELLAINKERFHSVILTPLGRAVADRYINTVWTLTKSDPRLKELLRDAEVCEPTDEEIEWAKSVKRN